MQNYQYRPICQYMEGRLYNSIRPHKIVKVKTLHDLNGIHNIFKVKDVYTIYPKGLLFKRH